MPIKIPRPMGTAGVASFGEGSFLAMSRAGMQARRVPMLAAQPTTAVDRSGAVVGGIQDGGIISTANPPPRMPRPNMPRLATGGSRQGETSGPPATFRNRQHPVRHRTKIDIGAMIRDIPEIHAEPDPSSRPDSVGLGSRDAASRMPVEPSRVMAATATIHPIGSRSWKPCSLPEGRESDFPMESVLEEIVARKRVEVEKARLVTPIESIKDRIRGARSTSELLPGGGGRSGAEELPDHRGGQAEKPVCRGHSGGFRSGGHRFTLPLRWCGCDLVPHRPPLLRW